MQLCGIKSGLTTSFIYNIYAICILQMTVTLYLTYIYKIDKYLYILLLLLLSLSINFCDLIEIVKIKDNIFFN